MWELLRHALRLPWTLAASGARQMQSAAAAATGTARASTPSRNAPPVTAPVPPPPDRASAARSTPRIGPEQLGRLDPSRIVVVGEDLAAGMGELSLHEDGQRSCFAALLARHLGAELEIPIFEAPGIGRPPGAPGTSVRLPGLLQTTVRGPYPPVRPPTNLAVPGFTLRDALRHRPRPPLLSGDPKGTAANLVLGGGLLLEGERCEAPTQVEAALRLDPTLLLVVLGYRDVVDAALARRPAIDRRAFGADFEELLHVLSRGRCPVVAATIPDPLDSAFFSSIEEAADVLRVEPGFLYGTYGLAVGDRLTPSGLIDVGCQVQTRVRRALAPEHVLASSIADELRVTVASLNGEIRARAATMGAHVYSLDELWHRVRSTGVPAGAHDVTGSYLGGFFSLNGFYPGATGHAAIANDLLARLGETFGAAIPPIDLEAIRVSDPVADYRRAGGARWSGRDLVMEAKVPDAPVGFADAAPRGARARKRVRAESDSVPLRLQSEGLERILRLNPARSYHGDGMRLVACPPGPAARFGDSPSLLFGGLALFGSHLHGALRVRFSPPKDGFADFELSFEDGGLAGEDSVLAAPVLYRFPILQPRVVHAAATACRGRVELATGLCFDLEFPLLFLNSGLGLLQRLNPTFPKAPIRFTSVTDDPLQYGTAWGRFVQRADGRLDFSFHGTFFAPLGDGVRFPLPFGGPDGSFATLPASGTALHPHLHLDTSEGESVRILRGAPELPSNAVEELVVHTRDSSFGDLFTLNAPGFGRALGRSRVTGRIQVQFGARFGDSIPICVSLLPPSGLFDDPSLSPLQDVFPARLSRGLLGHNEFLRFPRRKFYLDNVYLLEDPFDLALGAVDVRTGRVIGDFLHRGFIGQDLFFALVRIEPRTPQASFEFRGPAEFRRDADGRLSYRFDGQLKIPYPAGFLFPMPDLATGEVIGPDSVLDPYMIVEAHQAPVEQDARLAGGACGVTASIGGTFSYAYSISPEGEASFRYTNHTEEAEFEMHQHGLLSVQVTRGQRGRTVTFTGLGRWSRDPEGLNVASVQVTADYVSIQIGGGRISNVNTRPADAAKADALILASNGH